LSDDWVKVADALNEAEATVIVGHLESVGIEAAFDSRDEAWEGLGGLSSGTELGPQEIVVRAADADRARAALAERA
jgi:Putative prokaryotic signal transducing protein